MNPMFLEFALKRKAEGASPKQIAHDLQGMGLDARNAQILAIRVHQKPRGFTIPPWIAIPVMAVFALPVVLVPILGVRDAGLICGLFGVVIGCLGWGWILNIAFAYTSNWGLLVGLCGCAGPLFIIAHASTEPDWHGDVPPMIIYFAGLLLQIIGFIMYNNA
ncbi:MAG: hypothetical protein N2C14_06495 [Planctomycetales bacterium]